MTRSIPVYEVEPMEPVEILIAVLVYHSLVSAAFSAFVASEKGRDGAAWFFLGLLFGFLALLAIVGLPEIDNSLAAPEPRRRRCSVCFELILPEASICPYCQTVVEPISDEDAEPVGDEDDGGGYRVGVNVFPSRPSDYSYEYGKYIISVELFGSARFIGIKGGDRLLEVNGESIRDMSHRQVEQKLGRRYLDETVKLLISRVHEEGIWQQLGFRRAGSIEKEFVVKSDVQE
jgi:membrane-associated protease RseP (regulator of RpoE activity)